MNLGPIRHLFTGRRRVPFQGVVDWEIYDCQDTMNELGGANTIKKSQSRERCVKKALVLPLFFLIKKENMSDRATCWSVTINNPTRSDDDNIALAKQKSGWAVYGQKEVGESGTEHYQLMITTPQVRFSAVKKAFPRSHIEVARDRKALTKYVNKEDTRTGVLPTNSNYPSMSQMWDSFAEYYEANFKKHLCHYDWSPEKRLLVFDAFIKHEIINGKYVETMAVNPQIRSIVKNYLSEIIHRSLSHRQTDRQTDSENLSVDLDTNGKDSDEEGNEETDEEDNCTTSSTSESSC